MKHRELLESMRADAIPEGHRGLWRVVRHTVTPAQAAALARKHGRGYQATEAGRHTFLECRTSSTLHVDQGEVVMLDSYAELRSHLQFTLQAAGRVLVTGLGLGCVVRGLLQRPEVQRVDVVERQREVLELVGEFMPEDDRLHLVQDDAHAYVRRTDARWDYAWHDLWSNVDRGDRHLVVQHQALLLELRKRVRVQGAWAFPRHYRRLCRRLVPGEVI